MCRTINYNGWTKCTCLWLFGANEMANFVWESSVSKESHLDTTKKIFFLVGFVISRNLKHCCLLWHRLKVFKLKWKWNIYTFIVRLYGCQIWNAITSVFHIFWNCGIVLLSLACLKQFTEKMISNCAFWNENTMLLNMLIVLLTAEWAEVWMLMVWYGIRVRVKVWFM